MKSSKLSTVVAVLVTGYCYYWGYALGAGFGIETCLFTGLDWGAGARLEGVF